MISNAILNNLRVLTSRLAGCRHITARTKGTRSARSRLPFAPQAGPCILQVKSHKAQGIDIWEKWTSAANRRFSHHFGHPF